MRSATDDSNGDESQICPIFRMNGIGKYTVSFHLDTKPQLGQKYL